MADEDEDAIPAPELHNAAVCTICHAAYCRDCGVPCMCPNSTDP
jgi:hypothetical protein